jgi:VIT1/CCC1 family predicted Fe2+/Mn2+ transporter
VVIPFIFMQSTLPALRISNAIAITMMFISGYSYGRLTGYHPLRVAVAMVVLGAIVVSATIKLGG